jgi:fimbrial chaperone protein
MKHVVKYSALCVFLILLQANIFPFSFEPISMELSPSGRGATGSFILKNKSDDFVAIRISMYERSIDIDGKETRVPADHLFTIYPSNIVLKPDSLQSLRVKWTGESTLESERSFRIIVEQLPVDFGSDDSPSSGLQIMFRYIGSIYITPQSAAPELAIEEKLIDSDRRLQLVIHNRGSKHLILGDLHLIISENRNGTVNEIVIPPEDLTGIDGEIMLSGSRRRFFVNLPAEIKGDTFDVKLVYQEM